jgi:hypothetical protein
MNHKRMRLAKRQRNEGGSKCEELNGKALTSGAMIG